MSNGFSKVALKLTPVISCRSRVSGLPVTPFFVGTGRDLDHIWAAIVVMFGADKILEALRLTADADAQLPQMVGTDDAEQFRPHRPGVLLQQL